LTVGLTNKANLSIYEFPLESLVSIMEIVVTRRLLLHSFSFHLRTLIS